MCPPEPSYVKGNQNGPLDPCMDAHCWTALTSAFDSQVGWGNPRLATKGATVCLAPMSQWGGVECFPSDGGVPQPIAQGALCPVALAMDGQWAYWATQAIRPDGGAIEKVPLDGGAPITLASGPGIQMPIALGVDSSSLYWIDWSLGTLSSVPLDGGSVVNLVSGLFRPQALAVTAGGLYFTANRGEVDWLPLDGGAPLTLATGVQFAQGAWSCTTGGWYAPSFATDVFAAGTDALYWVDGNDDLTALPLTGGSPRVVTRLPNAMAIAPEGQALYAVSPGGVFSKTDLDGGQTQTIMGPMGGLDQTDLAVGPGAVYSLLGNMWFGSITPK